MFGLKGGLDSISQNNIKININFFWLWGLGCHIKKLQFLINKP